MHQLLHPFILPLILALLAVPAARGTAVDEDELLPADAVERPLPTTDFRQLGKQTSVFLGLVRIADRGYDDSHRLIHETQYKGDVKQGSERYWYPNGKLRSRVTYQDGRFEGIAQAWNDQGASLWKTTFVNGSGVFRTFYPTGVLQSECPYVASRQHGTERQWSSVATLLADTAYESGRRDGWSRSYYTNGLLRGESFYRDDQIHGVLRVWTLEGELVNPHGLTPAELGYANRDCTPHYYIHGKRVFDDEYQKAAATDPDLRRSLIASR